MTQTERVNGWRSAPNGFVEILPPGYDTSKKYPVMFWVHGQGELGDGSDKALDKLQRTVVTWTKTNDVGFIILVVQYPWNGYKITGFVRWALKNYLAINPGSMHMAGLSMGGYVIRDFIMEDSEVYRMFSTFTVMSSNLDAAIPFVDRIVKNRQYIWVHHGDSDSGANQATAVSRFIRAGQKLDLARFWMSLYRAMGHAAWEEVYDSSGREREEVSADTFDGVQLFKWLTGMFTWWTWLEHHAKDADQIPAPEEPEEPAPVQHDVVRSYYEEGFPVGALIFELKGGKRIKFTAGLEEELPVATS